MEKLDVPFPSVGGILEDMAGFHVFEQITHLSPCFHGRTWEEVGTRL